MGCIHIIEGPVGAGKTTFAGQLGKEFKTPPFILDDWMINLYRPDRPETDIWTWYAERKQRCLVQIWKVALGLLDSGNQAIVELGLLRTADRRLFCQQVESTSHTYQIYVLDLPQVDRWARVQKRNEEKGETFSMEVSEDVFTMASQMWEPPGAEEISELNVEFV
ncbi:AAA family ATPase [uncultured Tateyamaria sp.]|uniref:AAA family ATPase n=1 Tax=uncultured Tateyamaria sp. TaxID=455651 RepID=UPI00262ABBF7|nr:AAA family ATPase [uncultured Tateyamaria sp.]